MIKHIQSTKHQISNHHGTRILSFEFRASCLFVIWCLAIGASGASSRPTIVDRLMPLTHSSPRSATQPVDVILLHFSSDFLQHPDDAFNVDRVIQIYTDAKVSTHYLIDRDGHIYRLVEESRRAWHAGKGVLPWDRKRVDNLNSSSIGIEMLAVGSEADMVPLFCKAEHYRAFKEKHADAIGYTDAQYAALNELIDDIRGRFPLIKHDRYHILGHEEWAGRGRRTDPGELFDWTKIGLTRERP